MEETYVLMDDRDGKLVAKLVTPCYNMANQEYKKRTVDWLQKKNCRMVVHCYAMHPAGKPAWWL